MVYEKPSNWAIEKYIFLNCKIIRYQQLKSKDNQEIIR